jgi:hypothetical protein
MAQSPNIHPHPKHVHIKYHHFRQAVEDKDMIFHAIDTKDQVADHFTYPLGTDLFLKLQKLIMGWCYNNLP